MGVKASLVIPLQLSLVLGHSKNSNLSFPWSFKKSVIVLGRCEWPDGIRHPINTHSPLVRAAWSYVLVSVAVLLGWVRWGVASTRKVSNIQKRGGKTALGKSDGMTGDGLLFGRQNYCDCM